MCFFFFVITIHYHYKFHFVFIVLWIQLCNVQKYMILQNYWVTWTLLWKSTLCHWLCYWHWVTWVCWPLSRYSLQCTEYGVTCGTDPTMGNQFLLPVSFLPWMLYTATVTRIQIHNGLVLFFNCQLFSFRNPWKQQV